MIQISASIFYQIAPDEIMAKTVTKKLEDIDFPVAFKICMKPSFNDDELARVGYDYSYNYFLGRSKFEANTTDMRNYGWAGHTQDGGVFTNVSDVQSRIFKDYHSVIKLTTFYTIEGGLDLIPISRYQLRKPNYPNNCLTLDITKHIPPKDRLILLTISFESDLFATAIDVIIEDRLTLVDRIRQHGTRKHPIKYDSLKRKMQDTYMVSFEQNIFLDEDIMVCVNYPTDKYASFNDCDQQHLDKLLKKKSLYPAWFTPGDLSRATNLTKSAGLGAYIRGYFFGITSGPCVQPCTQTSIKAVYQFSDQPSGIDKTLPTIYLNFDPHVKVTTHAYPSFQPLEVLQVQQVLTRANSVKAIFSWYPLFNKNVLSSFCLFRRCLGSEQILTFLKAKE